MYFFFAESLSLYYFGLSRLPPPIILKKNDEAIYAQMARESKTDNTPQKTVRFELPEYQHKQPPVSFTLTMRQQHPTTSNQLHTVDSQRPPSKTPRKRLRRKKSEESSQQPNDTASGTVPPAITRRSHRAADCHLLRERANRHNTSNEQLDKQ